jgi:hypothetical protein
VYHHPFVVSDEHVHEKSSEGTSLTCNYFDINTKYFITKSINDFHPKIIVNIALINPIIINKPENALKIMLEVILLEVASLIIPVHSNRFAGKAIIPRVPFLTQMIGFLKSRVCLFLISSKLPRCLINTS